MSQSKFPKGWDEARVKRVLEHYETQTPEEAVAEDEAGFAASETMISVPQNLVAQVRELIMSNKR